MLSRMASGTAKRRSQRAFVVLTAFWILFCLFIQPILMAGRGFTHYQKDVQFCYEDVVTRQSNLRGCLAHAERELASGLYAGFGVEYDKGHSWSYGWYFRVMWQLLVAEIVVVPALIYGLAWIVASVLTWIWRVSRSTALPPPSGTQI
jgi:hypothetical protein